MFYFENGWKPYEKKVTYTQTVTEYDNDVTRFPEEVTIEDNILTDEELERLEVVKHSTASLDDVIAYVKTGIAQGQVIEANRAEQTRKAILASLDTANVAPEILIQSGLSRKWEPGSFMSAGELIEHNESLYTVLQSHQSQEDWTPDVSPSLFAPLLTSPTGEVLEWVQPDSTNPYMKGDRVLWTDGKTYESLIDNNVWSPEAYPAGWVEVTI